MVTPTFPQLLKSYFAFCTFRSKAQQTHEIDLSREAWFYPTTLLPLCNFIRENKNTMNYVPPSDPNVSRYLSLMADESSFKSAGDQYCPIARLPPTEADAGPILQKLYKLQNNGKNCGGENAFKYIVGELVDNIYEHSKFTAAYIMAQNYSTKHFVEICFFDNGISIPGCFRKHGLKFKDHEAIAEAVNGLSTKDIERGRGLGDTINILVKGLNGQILIATGKGALYLEEKNKTMHALSYMLTDDLALEGTLIGIRIPSPAKEVNIYDYIR